MFNTIIQIEYRCHVMNMLFGLGLCMNRVLKFQPHTPPSKYRGSPTPHPLPPTHIHRDNTALLSFRTFKHSEFLIKMSTLC